MLNAETLEFEQYALLESGTITIMGDDMSMFYSVTVDAKSGDYSVKVDYTGMMFSASSAGASLSPVASAAKVGALKLSQRTAAAFGPGPERVNPRVKALCALAR